jgi:hypothetical protein
MEVVGDKGCVVATSLLKFYILKASVTNKLGGV